MNKLWGYVKRLFIEENENYGEFYQFYLGYQVISILILYENKDIVIFHPVLNKLLQTNLNISWVNNIEELLIHWEELLNETNEDYFFIVL